MQHILRAFILFSAVVATLTIACSPKKSESPLTVLIPWPTEKGIYKYQNVELTTMSNINKLEGSAAQFIDKPVLSGSSLVGGDVHGNFFQNDKKVYVAKDFQSLNLITTYAHYERLNRLADEAGLLKILPMPRKISVGLKTNIGDLPQVNNAFHVGPLDMLVIVPYEAEGLPISMNAGILAHEYFHAIFEKLLLGQVMKLHREKLNSSPRIEEMSQHWIEADKKPNSLSAAAAAAAKQCEGQKPLTNDEINQLILGAINEGLADLWAWIYTGDPNFMSMTLKNTDRRKLKRELTQLPSVDTLQSSFIIQMAVAGCERERAIRSMHHAYCYWGTALAKLFYEFMHLDYKTDINMFHRRALAKKIVQSIQKFSEDILKDVHESRPITFNRFIQAYFKESKKLDKEYCSTLKRTMAKEGSDLEIYNEVAACKQ